MEAVFVMHEPMCWGATIQVIVDALRFGRKPEGCSHVPIFFSNPDSVWAAEYRAPRLAQGAFRECVRAVYEQQTGLKLQVTQYGKPHTTTYDYAKRVLDEQAHELGQGPITTYYGIGDNPESDIAGANAAGWESVLVRTGVFSSDAANDSVHPAALVVQDVEEGVNLICTTHTDSGS